MATKIFKVITSTLPIGTLGSAASLLAAALYQGNLDRNHQQLSVVIQLHVVHRWCNYILVIPGIYKKLDKSDVVRLIYIYCFISFSVLSDEN